MTQSALTLQGKTCNGCAAHGPRMHGQAVHVVEGSVRTHASRTVQHWVLPQIQARRWTDPVKPYLFLRKYTG